MQKLIKVGAVIGGISLLITVMPVRADSGYEVPEVQVVAIIDPQPAEIIIIEEIEEIVYTTDRVNIRYEPDLNAEILITAAAGTKLIRTAVDAEEGWDVVVIDEIEYYISNEYFTTEEPEVIADAIEDQIAIKASDLRYLSAIIFAEAGNQCKAGQYAVGIIIMNRSESGKFNNGIYNVIYQIGQFTPVFNGSLNKALALYDSGELSEDCIEAAKYALLGNKTVYYNGSTYDLSDYYYFSRYLNKARLIIEEHMFR